MPPAGLQTGVGSLDFYLLVFWGHALLEIGFQAASQPEASEQSHLGILI
jgi:hypothetical protein